MNKILKIISLYLWKSIKFIFNIIFWFISATMILGATTKVILMPFACDNDIVIYLSLFITCMTLIVLLGYFLETNKTKLAYLTAFSFWLFEIIVIGFSISGIAANCNGFYYWDPDW